ncbi:MAG TPA: DUF4234 domain-containing protein [Candidatus Saccharimonadales bacterium]|nr:DUF4234 domain-containing protein [Candidatus Saccharimonadales bacterium]
MTDTASRPDMTPAVATLTLPENAEAVEPAATEELPVRSWSWPAAAGPIDAVADPVDLTEPVAAEADTEEAVAETEIAVTGVAVPERPMPGMTSSLGPVGKHRSTFAVVALSVVTLGIYSLVWHNRVNHEVGNFDTRMHVIPSRSTLAVTIPWALGWLVSLVGATRIVLAVLNVTLPFNPHFTVLQAYGLLAGGIVIPYLTLLLPFSAVAWVMTLERVRIVEDRIGKTTDVQLRPTRVLCWLLFPVAGGLVLIATVQRRLNRVWEDDKATTPPARPSVRATAS